MKQELASGKFLRLMKIENNWESVERVNADKVVLIIAITDDDKIVLVEQFRYPIGSNCIELPAGLVGDVRKGESTLDAAKAELLEETGYEADHWQFIMSGVLSPGMSNEIADVYCATGLKKVHDGPVDESEKITVHEVDIDRYSFADWEINDKPRRSILDTKIYAGLYVAEFFVQERDESH
jgi:ADP-ribose pyrophosphatase